MEVIISIFSTNEDNYSQGKNKIFFHSSIGQVPPKFGCPKVKFARPKNEIKK